MRMNRLLRILLLVFLLGPQLSEMTVLVLEHCEESADCCAEGPDDAACLQCSCCFTGAPGTAVLAVAPSPFSPPAGEAVEPTHFCPPPSSADILHVPKSTLA